VTSDKSTLHVFDMPQFGQTKPDGTAGRSFSSSSYPEEDGGPAQKWGVMGKIPFLPRVFSDEYSFASVPFESGDDITPGVSITGNFTAPPIPGLPGGRAAKGHIGWLDDETILVIGAGRDARWERFELVRGEDGKRYCVRRGWRRYLGN
jgi:WD repeat-containing protein 45